MRWQDKLRSMAGISVIALIATLVVTAPASAETVNPAPSVVPRLQEWTGGTGTFQVTGSSRIVVDPATAQLSTSGVSDPLASSRTLSEVAEIIASDLGADTGLWPDIVVSGTANPGDITLTLGADAGLGAEGYQLQVSDRVTISAPATDGVFNASRTMLQALRLSVDNLTLPVGGARDWPDLRYRAEHFDVSRRYMDVNDIQDPGSRWKRNTS